ncbi:carbohydrate kinase family protein [Kribbella italica]|uniref:Sugar/nucleoside kinase (Ribokinase family) n=1 Tax=Kribbella italica TaxID=1540520 RepID=A0A7W9JFF1_9ACTN|nr:carbohydrate kinase family protein [Kribbella italica]MBB5841144.1 sugar/nucleoside kinase (ribokinase family) [Kribbella italica]
MFDLLVLGDANPDVVIGPVNQPLVFGQRERLVPTGSLCLGGSAAIMACGAARLGLKVAFAGRIGDDPAGTFVRSALEERGVDTSALVVDPGLPTPLTTVLTSGSDRAILTASGCLASTSSNDVPRTLLRSVRHVHAASFYLMPDLAAGLAELFKEARSAKASTSLDTNDDPADRWERVVLDPVLRVTDYLLPNAAEAHALTGHPVLAEAAGILARRGPLVVVKNGADGALAHNGTSMLSAPALAVEPVDTVGAGDSFDAGFVAAVLRRTGRARALAIAAACGSLSTRAAGGTAAQADWDLAVESAG